MENGWIVFARQTLESDIWLYKPAEWFKIWMYILSKVNHTENKHFKRGTNFFRWTTVAIECPGITEHQWHECVSWLKRQTQITTQKTTRGNIITVINYDKYQKTKVLKPTQEPTQKPIDDRHTTDTINNNVTMEQELHTHTEQTEKFFIDPEPVIQKLLQKGYPEDFIRQEVKKFISYWTEPNKKNKEKWKLKETFEVSRRLATWFNNIKTRQGQTTKERKIWRQPSPTTP